MFVDGAFWHGHPSRFKPGRSGRYWDGKIAGNVRRDREVDELLLGQGWAVLRVWDFEVRTDLEGVVDRVERTLARRLPASPRSLWQTALRARVVERLS